MWRNMLSAVILTAITVGVSWGVVLPPDGWRYAMPLAVYPASNQIEPEVASCRDSVYVAWIDQRTSPYLVYLKRSFDKGFTWLTEQPITGSDTVRRHLSVAVAPNSNRAYLLWTSGPTNGPYGLKFARSTNRGQSWLAVQVLDGNLLVEPSGSIFVDGNGHVHVAYYRRRDPISKYNHLMYARSTNQGQTFSWTSVFPVGTLGYVVQTAIATVLIGGAHRPQITSTINSTSYHTHNTGAGWTTNQMGTYPSTGNEYAIDMASDQQNALHFCFAQSAAQLGYLSYRKGTFTAPNTWTWTDTVVLHSQEGTGDPSIACHGSNLQVVFSAYEATGVYSISHSRSNDFGSTWIQWNGQRSQYLWTGPSYNNNPAIAVGVNERHVVFTSTSAIDIYYLTNDDLLVSDNPEATAFNWGRHLVRDPWSGLGGRLHAVYFSQGRPHHSYSDDNGTSWSPYHIIENIQQVKDSGSYPTVGLVPGPAFNYHPCVVYLNLEKKVEYRYLDVNGVWQAFTVRGNTNGVNGPPSVAALGDGMVYVMIPVKSLPSEVPAWSAIKFYGFYYTTGPGTESELDWVGDMTALGEPCITVDGNYDLHCVWRKSGDIRYAKRISGTWYWDSPLFPLTPAYSSKTPFIECYGTQLAVPFVDVYASDNTEIMWSNRDFSQPPPLDQWSTPPTRITTSAAIMSDYPTSASCDFTVWSEQRTTPSGNYDVKWYWHPQTRSGWAAETPPKSYFPHSLQYYDLEVGHYDLITARTEGNATPYQIVATHEGLSPSLGGEAAYYGVETGKDNPSFFCTKRDGFIRYARYDVDYGTSQLEYTLTLLNPLYPAYRVKILSYFEGTGNRTEKVLVDGQEHTTLDLKPNQLNVSTILVTREYYKNDHKAVVAFQGAGAVKAGLVVYQLEKLTSSGYSSGGSQSAEVSSARRNFQLSISPNPVYGSAVVSYTIPITSRVSLKLFDGAGRLIRVLDKGTRASGVHRFDIPTEKLAQGVYFLRLETTNETKVQKMIIVK